MKVLTNNQYYSQIANVIREQNGTNNTYKPVQIVSALKDLFYEEVEGVPPINFQGIGENLLDYRIDGASGGVGERTSNLVDKTKFIYGYRLSNIGTLYTTPSEQNLFAVSEFIEVNSGEQYIISQRDATRGYARRISFYQSKNENSWLSNNDDSDLIFTVPNTATYLKFTTMQNYIDSIMLIRGTSLPTTYEHYGYKVPVVMNGKNLFDELQVVDTTVSSEMSNYQIFKQNEKLIINGLTTSSQSDVEIANINSINNQALQFINSNEAQYIFSAEVPGRIMIRYKLLGSDVVRYTFDEYNSSNRVADRIVFRLQQNYQYNNEQMNIMFKLKQIQLADYEAYHEPTTTNIYLDEPIEANESISLSDTNVNIPTIRGTNVLTVDTTIQPSNVYVKSRKESQYETAMRENYEQELLDIESALQEV